MKKLTAFILLTVCFISCHKMSFDDNETGNESKTRCMYFRFGGFTMTGMEEMSPDDNSESRTSTNQANYTDNMLLGIFDTDGNIVDSIQYQSKDDSNTSYGSFSHTLKYGKYTVLAIGWNGTQKCHVASLDSIYFSENWVPNTFLCRQNFIVNDTYSDTRTLTLRRCVAKFVLSFKDEIIPNDLSHFTIDISGAGNTLNSETRHCTHIQDFSRKIPVDISPTKIKSLTSYCILPKDSAGITIDIVAYDSNGDTVSHKNFTQVPMKINYSTNYTGNFYNFASATDDLSFETAFDGEFNHNF